MPPSNTFDNENPIKVMPRRERTVRFHINMLCVVDCNYIVHRKLLLLLFLGRFCFITPEYKLWIFCRSLRCNREL